MGVVLAGLLVGVPPIFWEASNLLVGVPPIDSLFTTWCAGETLFRGDCRRVGEFLLLLETLLKRLETLLLVTGLEDTSSDFRRVGEFSIIDTLPKRFDEALLLVAGLEETSPDFRRVGELSFIEPKRFEEALLLVTGLEFTSADSEFLRVFLPEKLSAESKLLRVPMRLRRTLRLRGLAVAASEESLLTAGQAGMEEVRMRENRKLEPFSVES